MLSKTLVNGLHEIGHCCLSCLALSDGKLPWLRSQLPELTQVATGHDWIGHSIFDCSMEGWTNCKLLSDSTRLPVSYAWFIGMAHWA